MPKQLSNEDATALGMKFAHNQMDNGEFRFRAMNADSSGYIRTEMPESTPGEWQNAHYHGVGPLVRAVGWRRRLPPRNDIFNNPRIGSVTHNLLVDIRRGYLSLDVEKPSLAHEKTLWHTASDYL